MKKHLHIMLATLIVFVLTACQATPATPVGSIARPALDFFKDDATRWISVSPPTGWVPMLGGSSTVPSVIVTNNKDDYLAGSSKAISIIIAPLTDTGSASDVLQIVLKRFDRLLTAPTSEMVLAQANGQSYAKIEYQGKAADNGDIVTHYFMTVIATEKRSVFIFTSISPEKEKDVRLVFENLVNGITLH